MTCADVVPRAAESKQTMKRGTAEALGRAAATHGVPIHMVARFQTHYAVSRSLHRSLAEFSRSRVKLKFCQPDHP